MTSFSKEDCQNLVLFLDRVPVTGHQERIVMNQIMKKIALTIKPSVFHEDINKEETSLRKVE